MTGNCATAIATSAQTITSTMSATPPMSLRSRMDMGRWGSIAGTAAQLYDPRPHDQQCYIARDTPPRHQGMAAGGRGLDVRDLGRGRGDAAHRVRAVDRRVEAG